MRAVTYSFFPKEDLRINDLTYLLWKQETAYRMVRAIYFELGSPVILIIVWPLGIKWLHLPLKSPQRHWNPERSIGKEQPVTEVLWLWDDNFFFFCSICCSLMHLPGWVLDTGHCSFHSTGCTPGCWACLLVSISCNFAVRLKVDRAINSLNVCVKHNLHM